MNKKKPQTIILIAAGIVLALALIWALDARRAQRAWRDCG